MSLEILRTARPDDLAGKALVDVANPLDFSQGFPATLSVANTDSLGSRFSASFPRRKVVKALNTINHLVMVEPNRVRGDHDLFVAGDDEEAKSVVKKLLQGFG